MDLLSNFNCCASEDADAKLTTTLVIVARGGRDIGRREASSCCTRTTTTTATTTSAMKKKKKRNQLLQGESCLVVLSREKRVEENCDFVNRLEDFNNYNCNLNRFDQRNELKNLLRLKQHDKRRQPFTCSPIDKVKNYKQVNDETMKNLTLTSERAGRRRGKNKFSAPNLRLLCVSLLAACLLTDATSALAARRAQISNFSQLAHQVARRQATTSSDDTVASPETTTTQPDEQDEPTTARAATSVAPPATTTSTTTTTQATPSETNGGGNQRAGGKFPPVNYTRVDELFEGVMSELEVTQKWRKMDKTLQTGIGAVLKIVFPHIVSMASDAKVSGNCSGAILKWILNLKNMRTWAVKMLDAIGKPTAGILEGSLTLFGNYKQCLSVRAPDEDEIEISDGGEFKEYFRGQYCVLQIRPPLTEKPRFYSLNSTISSLLRKSYKYYEKSVYDDLSELAMAFNFVNIRADLCVPSLCSRDDIQRVADFLTNKVEMRARVQRCEIMPPTRNELEQQTLSTNYNNQNNNNNQNNSFDAHHIFYSSIFLIILFLVLVSTLTSLIFRMKRRTSKSKTRSLFTSMSVYRSLSHMKNVQLERINDSKPVVLYALRIFILLWIFLINLTSQLNFQFLRELLELRNVIMLWPMQLIVNSTLAYDSLILLTAFTYSYQNINSNLADLIKYNLSKYSRLMPSIMLFVGLTIVTPLLYQWRSPIWADFVQEPADVCKSNGFVNFFFLQNMLNSKAICLPHTWIFCVELQLCLLAVPIVYMMNKTFDAQHGSFKWLSAPILLLQSLAIFGCLINFANVYSKQLPAAWFQTFPDKDDKNAYFTAHLHKTWTHLTTFAIGLITGRLCRCQAIETFTGRPYGRNCCNTLMWLTSGLLMGLLLFCTHAWSLTGTSHLDSPLLSATYAALAPLGWSLGLSLILFQLTVPADLSTSHRSCFLQLLTSDVNLVRVGRLSFLAYLINPYVNNFIYAVQEQPIFSSILMLAHTFIGNLVITFAVAFLVSALVELPCRRLIKKLLIGSRRQSSNLDIITRQLDIRERASSHPPRMAFSAANAAQQQAQQRQHQKHLYAANHNSAAMIPLK